MPKRAPAAPAAQHLEHRLELPPSPGGLRLDLALSRALPRYSRSRLAGWIKEGAVSVDGHAARPRDAVYGGESVVVSARTVADERIEAHAPLVEALRLHAVQREYVALCVGALTGGGTIDRPIGRHRTDRLRMTVRADGRAAVTHYRLVERFPHHSLLRVELETGRTHQIRVHLSHMGHPLVGDPLYGGRRQLTAGTSPAQRKALQSFGRQALHAARLCFRHPVSDKRIEVNSPLPADFEALLDVLREPADA